MFFLVVVLTQEEAGAERRQGQGHPVRERARARSRSVIETVRRKRFGGKYVSVRLLSSAPGKLFFCPSRD